MSECEESLTSEPKTFKLKDGLKRYLKARKEFMVSITQTKIIDFKVLSESIEYELMYEGFFVDKSSKVKFELMSADPNRDPVLNTEWRKRKLQDSMNLTAQEFRIKTILEAAFQCVEESFTKDHHGNRWIEKDDQRPEIMLPESIGPEAAVLAISVMEAFENKMNNSQGHEFIMNLLNYSIDFIGLKNSAFVKLVDTNPHSLDAGVLDTPRSSSETSDPLSTDEESSCAFAKKRRLNPPYKIRSDIQKDFQVVEWLSSDDKYVRHMVIEVQSGDYKPSHVTHIVKNMLLCLDKDEVFGLLVFSNGAQLIRLFVDKEASNENKKVLKLANQPVMFLAHCLKNCLLEMVTDITDILNYCHIKSVSQTVHG